MSSLMQVPVYLFGKTVRAHVYLFWCYHIHIFSSQISMDNVVYMKVVESRCYLRQKGDDVPLITSSVENVFLEVSPVTFR